ncbi:unnamed protein product [Hyaloperonospora brassicae]|uniref:Urease accessory protein UreH-like transmembrane domain-containing protein n=1 Tax=Hyaloperonospora brassicae TaxID=162125 RepID=A0AAV0T3N9_HYABA|nr:unnamed protein product [Hyaloperonospora brassicae]
MDVAVAAHRGLHAENETNATTETTALQQASLGQLVLTGTLFGLIHVLTGPDHLSALATLSAGTSWRSFSLGMRWGCGHSIGLMVMAVIFVALDGQLDFTVLNVVTDVIVGVFMIALGLYGVLEGVKKARRSKRRGTAQRQWDSCGKHESEEEKMMKKKKVETGVSDETEDETGEGSETEMKTTVDSDGSPTRILLNGEATPSPDEIVVSSSSRCDEEVPLDARWRRSEAMRIGESCDASAGEKSLTVDMAAELSRRHSDSEETMSTATSPCESAVALEELLPDRSESLDEAGCRIDDAEYGTGLICCGIRLPTIDFQNARTQKCTALLVGIVHGIAGPGGILGVLPAVGLHDTIKSFTYLCSFCLTSIVTMGVFAAAYGEATGRLGDRSEVLAFRVSMFSSSLSVVVGVLWLVLTAMGKLQEVFG